METTSNDNLPIHVDQAVLATKKEAWAKIGASVYESELKFQAWAQKVINAVKLPTTIQEVAQFGEESLKKLKKAQNEIEAARKEITDRVAVPMKRLMEPEKSFEPKIKELSDCILKIKKDYEAEQRKSALKETERKQITEAAKKHLADTIAFFKNKIIDQVSLAHKWALENNVTLDTVQEYVSKCSDKFKVTDFAPVYPGVSFSLLTASEVEAIFKEHIVIDANEYIDSYRSQLKDKFEFYNVDFANKEQALEKNTMELIEQKQEVEGDKINQQLVASFETNAESLHDIGSGVKALKKSYKVQMEENLANAMIIMTAFGANIDKCKEKLRLTKYFNLDIHKMAEALAKVKNDDNKFTVTGINFVEVETL